MAFYPMISLIGPDGSGKTTIANELSKRIQNSEVIYMGRAKSNVNKISSKIKERKPWMYFIASFLYFVDLLIKYWFYVFPLRFKKVVITDRYISDMYLMKHVPKFLKKVYLFFTPKPTFTFYLWNDVEVLHQRKGHDKEDLKRQMELLGELDSIKIKNDDIDDTVEKILKMVCRKPYGGGFMKLKSTPSS